MILHLYAGAVIWDLTVDQYSTQKDQCSTTHIGNPTATIQTPSKMQPQTAYISFAYMLMPTTNSSRRELGESIIFQPVLQAYPAHCSWIITAHVSLGNLECHLKAFNRQLARTQQLLHSLDQQPSVQTQLPSMLQVEHSNIEDIYSSVKTTTISAIKLL